LSLKLSETAPAEAAAEPVTIPETAA